MKHRPQDFVFEDCFPKEDAPKTRPRILLLLPLLMLAASAVLVFLLTR